MLEYGDVFPFHESPQKQLRRAKYAIGAARRGMGPAGPFWFFSVVTLIGGLWAWFFIPETAGMSLESMDRLFTLRWYQIGMRGQKEAEMQQTVEDEEMRDQRQLGRSCAEGKGLNAFGLFHRVEDDSNDGITAHGSEMALSAFPHSERRITHFEKPILSPVAAQLCDEGFLDRKENRQTYT